VGRNGALRVGIVSGEPSGDRLGAGLARALRQHCGQDLRLEGIGGELLQAEGCRVFYPMERLAVVGIAELAGRLRELLRIRRELRDRFLAQPPDIFVGVDAPEFNLDLELALRRRGVRTVHYVSPQVWAWRRYRIRKISRAADLLLTQFPFEERFCREHGVRARCVGHSLADHIRPGGGAAARAALGIAPEGPLAALLPGSREHELQRLIEPFLLTARWCSRQAPELRFAAAPLNAAATEQVREAHRRLCPELPLSIHGGRSLEVMRAADAVLLASGTATLEAMLLERPMVVAYRLSGLTYWLLRRLVQVPCYSLPNILAGRALVPEFVQGEVCPERLGPALLDCLREDPERAGWPRVFRELRAGLQRGADANAARAVLEVAGGAAQRA